MKNDLNAIKHIHDGEGRQKIQQIQSKIGTTKYNIEVSEEIMDETPSDTHRDQLKAKNENRKHAIAGLQREIRDIEQELER